MPALRVREIKVDKSVKKVFCTISFPNVKTVPQELKKNIVDCVKSVVPKGYYCSVTFADDKFTELTFRRYLFDYIKKRYPLFNCIDKEKTIVEFPSDDKISVTFFVNEIVKNSIEIADFCNSLQQHFENYTSYCVEIVAEIDENAAVINRVEEQERLVRLAINKELLKPSRHIRLTDVSPHIGKEILGLPMYISDIRSAMDSCIICGKVSNKTLKALKNKPNTQICSFTLTDQSGGSIKCTMFVEFQITDPETLKQTLPDKSENEVVNISRRKMAANDKKMKKLMAIYDTMSVVVRGKIAYSKYSEQLEMRVYDLCNCNILPISSLAEFTRPVPCDYVLVHPTIISEFRQIGFDQTEIVSPLLKGKSVIVLDADVTGKNAMKDKILSVCGIKIVNGHICQRFQTFVNPEMQIDEKLLSKCGTSIEKLPFFPTVTEIVGDLYKFVHGSTLVGSGLQSVLDILNYYAAPVGYKFDNPILERAEMLSGMFDDASVSKKPDCQKVAEVAKACKIASPVDDTAATRADLYARCVVNLSGRYSAF